MHSRVPVLAAVSLVALVEAVAGRGGRAAADRPHATPGHPPRVSSPPPSTDTAGPSSRRRWRLTGAAALAGAAALGLALPSAVPSSAASAGASPTVAVPQAGDPQDRHPLEAARQRVAAERRDAAQAQVSRSRRSADQPGVPSSSGTASGGAEAGVSAAGDTAAGVTAAGDIAAGGTTAGETAAGGARSAGPAEGGTPGGARPTTPPDASRRGPSPGAAPVPGPVTPATVAPVAAPVGSAYGYRWGRLHAGLDFPAPHGTPVLAVADGTVEQAGPAGGYGKLVTIRHGDGTVTAYGHMRVVAVAPGEAVRAGQLIAEVGSEGRSTGPHLHFEVRTPEGTRDPRPWLAERGVAL